MARGRLEEEGRMHEHLPDTERQRRRALVTGGAGFIGSHLVDQLMSDGWAVTVLDDLSSGDPGNLVEHPGILQQGCVTNMDDVLAAAEGCTHIFHLAARGSVPRSIALPIETDRVNVSGTLTVLEAARRLDVERVVYSSSSSVYGDDTSPTKKVGRTGRPLSPYAVSKLAGENYAEVYAALHGVEAVTLRFFNVFGPRQRVGQAYAAVIPNFCEAAIGGDDLVIFGDGEQSRDFTYVANNVQAMLRCASAPAEAVAGRTFNVGTGSSTSVTKLARLILDRISSTSSIRYRSRRAGDAGNSVAEIDGLVDAVGYHPEIGLEEGLDLTAEWYRQVLSPSQR